MEPNRCPEAAALSAVRGGVFARFGRAARPHAKREELGAESDLLGLPELEYLRKVLSAGVDSGSLERMDTEDSTPRSSVAARLIRRSPLVAVAGVLAVVFSHWLASMVWHFDQGRVGVPPAPAEGGQPGTFSWAWFCAAVFPVYILAGLTWGSIAIEQWKGIRLRAWFLLFFPLAVLMTFLVVGLITAPITRASDYLLLDGYP